jgi:hypothetical protein
LWLLAEEAVVVPILVDLIMAPAAEAVRVDSGQIFLDIHYQVRHFQYHQVLIQLLLVVGGTENLLMVQ